MAALLPACLEQLAASGGGATQAETGSPPPLPVSSNKGEEEIDWFDLTCMIVHASGLLQPSGLMMTSLVLFLEGLDLSCKITNPFQVLKISGSHTKSLLKTSLKSDCGLNNAGSSSFPQEQRGISMLPDHHV